MAIKSSKQKLVNDLRALLIAGKVTTQDEICTALDALGHEINQSKVSRLLRKIDAVKSKNELGKIVYRLPQEPAPPTTSNLLSSLLIDVNANETTIIVTTSPGAAQLVARMIDYNKINLHVLGSIAGDDAVFVAPKSVRNIQATINAIKQLLFGKL